MEKITIFWELKFLFSLILLFTANKIIWLKSKYDKLLN